MRTRPPGSVDAALIDSARAFAERHPAALARDACGAIEPAVLDDARRLGLFGLALPERSGGLGLGLGPVAAVIAEIARIDRSIATTIGLHNGLGTRAIVRAASPSLSDELLPDLASGARIAAFAATEPAAGSDLSLLATRIRLERRRFLLSGHKAYVTNAGLAGCFTVLARTDGSSSGRAALAVTFAEAPGLSLGAEERKMGLRASSTRSVYFDDVVLGPERLLDDGRDGTLGALTAIEWGRALLSAGCLGTARAALERSLVHTTARRQFRRSLRSLGAVRAHLSAMASAVAAIEAGIERVAALDEAGASIEPQAAALKILASELACDAADRAIQVHGALGFVEDAGIAILARDARVTRIFEGANDVLLVRLGTSLLSGKPLSADVAHPDEASLALAGDRLRRAIGGARSSLGVGAVNQQVLLTALARADIALWAADAIGRARTLGGPGRKAALAVARRRLGAAALRALDGADGAVGSEREDAALVDVLGDDGAELVRPSVAAEDVAR